MKRRLALGALVAVGALAGALAWRGATFVAPERARLDEATQALDANRLAAHLSQAVRIPTVSPQPPQAADPAAFDAFVAWLAATYPQAHARLQREVVGGHSLVYTWRGADPAGRPALLTAHYDVVPVMPGSEAQWKHPPFAGDVADGHVWGRGTLDDKGNVVALMEAVTWLLEQGWQPRNPLVLAFGHDEELGGTRGAAAIAAHLKTKGVRAAWSLDEGSFVIDGIVPGLARPVALVSVAEKGYLTVEISARGDGGHSSMPPARTAVGTLAQAIVKLQDAPMPGGLDGLTLASLDAMAREMSFGKRVLFANRWLFGPLIERELARSPATNALLRTTTAPTMLSASVKENVLPTQATATVNFRLHPRDTAQGVAEHVRRVTADERITVTAGESLEASPVSPSQAPGFRAVADAARRSHGDVAVAPGLTIGATDSRHYATVSDASYRFMPARIGPADVAGYHGTNERLSVDNLVRATRFYIELMKSEAR
jgi:carboxypeptidase PM20D1